MARAAKDDTSPDDRGGRIAQVRAVWSLARAQDSKLALRVFGPALAVLVVLVVVGILIGHPIYFSILGVMSGPLVRSSYRAGRLYADAVAARSAQTAN